MRSLVFFVSLALLTTACGASIDGGASTGPGDASLTNDANAPNDVFTVSDVRPVGDVTSLLDTSNPSCPTSMPTLEAPCTQLEGTKCSYVTARCADQSKIVQFDFACQKQVWQTFVEVAGTCGISGTSSYGPFTCEAPTGSVQINESMRSCTSDSDCVAKTYMIDCCGTEKYFGINQQTLPLFDYCTKKNQNKPVCDCIAQPTRTDDGSLAPNASQVKTKCISIRGTPEPKICYTTISP